MTKQPMTTLEENITIEEVLKEQFPLQNDEHDVKICKITNFHYRLNFWAKRKTKDCKLLNNLIVRSLWIHVYKTQDGWVCENIPE